MHLLNHMTVFPRLILLGVFLTAVFLLVYAVPANAADAPSGLTPTAGDTQATLTWNGPNGSSTTGYRALWMEPLTNRMLETGDWTDIAGSDATTTTHTATGLTNGIEHAFYLRAENGAGPGPASEDASVTPNLLKPNRPAGLTATAGNTVVDLAWTEAVTSATQPIDNYELLQLALRKLASSDGMSDDLFGHAVAVDGDTAVVGAHSDNSKTGSAFIFTRDTATGAWSQEAKLTAPDGETGDAFGYSVAVDGDTVVVGMPGDDIDTNGDNTDETNVGSAYVFVRPDTGWSAWDSLDAAGKAALTAMLTASDGDSGEVFGSSVGGVRRYRRGRNTLGRHRHRRRQHR